MTEKTPRLFSTYKPYVSPGSAQFYPVFLLEMLDYNEGRILTYHEGNLFEGDDEFFRKGEPRRSVANDIPLPVAVVAATAFPIFFSKVSVGRTKLIDAGLIDNQAIYSFHPLFKKRFQKPLNSDDCWFFSNAGRAMNVPAGGTTDVLGVNPKVPKLSPLDRIFRLTRDLAQPKMNRFIMDMAESGFGSRIFGVDIAFSHLDQAAWIEGDNIKTAHQAAALPTALSSLSRSDALAIISHGAQCAANALDVDGTVRNRIRLGLESLK